MVEWDQMIAYRYVAFTSRKNQNESDGTYLFVSRIGNGFILRRIVCSAILTRGQVTKHPWRNSSPLKPSRMLHTKRLKSMVVWDASKELPVERYLRDAKITEIYERKSEMQRLVISRSELGLK